MDVLISGSSGLIGTALRQALSDAGHRPVRLVRRDPSPGADEIKWDIAAGTIDAASIEGTDAVVHLAGAGIGDRRWNESYKETIRRSRTDGTRLLASTLAGLDRPPSVFLSGSAIGYYGPRGDDEITEETPAGDTYLADVCIEWEDAARPAVEAGIPTAFLRTGIVQSADGGALRRLLYPHEFVVAMLTPGRWALAERLPQFKIPLGVRFGSGQQYQSWITLDDVVSSIIFLLSGTVTGPVNLTAPAPVRNTDFAAVLKQVLGQLAVLPLPALGPRLLLGREMTDALLFESQRVLPTKLLDAGFEFAHPDLETGLRALLDR